MRVVVAGAVPTTRVKLAPQNLDSVIWEDNKWRRHVRSTAANERCLTHARLEFDTPLWRPQFRHRGCMEQLPALSGCPASPAFGLLPAGAIRRDSIARIHLLVEL